jgi:type II secretory pathway pseudopilin PulG
MSPLANKDPLAQLNDIIAPTAPNWFPPAPIYWALLIVSIALIFIVYYFVKKIQKQQKMQKAQLAQLVQLEQQKENFVALNQLLKGCALNYFSRDEVASLHGEHWFEFLQKYATAPMFKNKQEFLQRLYQTDIHSIDDKDFSDAKRWIIELPKQIKKNKKKQEIKDV